MWYGLIGLYLVVGAAVLACSMVMSKIMWFRLPWWKRILLGWAIVLLWPAAFVMAMVIMWDDRRRA